MKKAAIITASIALLLSIVMVATYTAEPDIAKTRFDSVFSATTLDNVELKVRLIGSYSTKVWNGAEEFVVVFSSEVREKLASINYADIPTKIKLLFAETLGELEDAGAKIDSMHEYKAEEADE